MVKVKKASKYITYDTVIFSGDSNQGNYIKE